MIEIFDSIIFVSKMQIFLQMLDIKKVSVGRYLLRFVCDRVISGLPPS